MPESATPKPPDDLGESWLDIIVTMYPAQWPFDAALNASAELAALREGVKNWKDSAERHYEDSRGLMRYRDQLERQLEDVKSIVVRLSNQLESETSALRARLATATELVKEAYPHIVALDDARNDGLSGRLAAFLEGCR